MVPDRLYFGSENDSHQHTLWVTDGTPSGTREVAPGFGPAGLAPFSFATVGDKVFLGGLNASARPSLFVLDGTAGTLTELQPAGASPDGLLPRGITAYNGAAYFSGRNADGGTTLWRSDGTAAGTTEIPVAGQGVFGLAPHHLSLLGDKLAFGGSDLSANDNLYVSDGTSAGTVKVPLVEKPLFLNLRDMASLGGRVVFGALVPPTLWQGLWVSDGTVAGSGVLRVPGLNTSDYPNDPAGLTSFGTRVAFTAGTASGTLAIWTTDGTVAGTVELPGPTAPSRGTAMAALPDGRLAFIASDASGQSGIWITDGTASGTAPLHVPDASAAGLRPDNVMVLGDSILFDGVVSSGARLLFISDGTTAGTAPLATGVTLIGGSGPQSAALPGDTIRGTVRDDLLTDSPASQLIIGYDGHDTLVVGERFRGSTLTRLANGDLALAHAGQSDTLRGLEEIRFLDGRLTFDANDPAAAVTRLYQAALGRAPDVEGLNFWTAAIQGGRPLADLAAAFLSSPEFAARFGSGGDNQAFVAAIYGNVLGRAPDADGFAFWAGRLDGGAARAEVLAAISESAENRAITAPLSEAGIWDRSEAAQQVARLYGTALGHLPDTGGLAFWTGAIERGTSTLADLAQALVASPEFAAASGALGNRAFVDQAYANTLGRPGDAEGVAYWTKALDNGLSRAAAVIGFSESPEHQFRTADTNLA